MDRQCKSGFAADLSSIGGDGLFAGECACGRGVPDTPRGATSISGGRFPSEGVDRAETSAIILGTDCALAA